MNRHLPLARHQVGGRENNVRRSLLPYLKLLPARRTQEIFAVRMSEHVEAQFVRAAEGLVALCTLVDLF